MATWVTVVEIRQVITTSLSDDAITDNMLRTAHDYIEDHLLSAGLSANALRAIELYLAAHFVALTEEKGGITWSELGDSRERYSDIYGKGFAATRYGQTAMSLDTSGILTKLSSPKLKAEFRVV